MGRMYSKYTEISIGGNWGQAAPAPLSPGANRSHYSLQLRSAWSYGSGESIITTDRLWERGENNKMRSLLNRILFLPPSAFIFFFFLS